MSNPFSMRLRVAGFSLFILRRALAHRCVQVAASLTFTTLLSLVPLMIVGLIVLSAFPLFSEYNTKFKALLVTTLVPDFAGKIITVYMRQFSENLGRLTVAGIAITGATAFMLLRTIDLTFNHIWLVSKARPLKQQFLVYWAILTLGPLLLGAGLWTNNWVLHGSGLLQDLQGLSVFISLGNELLLTTLMLAMLYGWVPNRFVPVRHALVGAGIAALLLQLAKGAFAYYIGQAKTYQLVYGAFASFPIMLLWLQLIWGVVLLGAELTAGLSYWRDGAWRRRNAMHHRFQDALHVLLCLMQAQNEGRTLSQRQLRRSVAVGYDEMGAVLDALADAELVQRGQADQWVLVRAPDKLYLDELYRLFVLRLDPAAHSSVSRALQPLLSPTFAQLSVSLAEFARLRGE